MSGPHENIHGSTENAEDLHVPHGIAHYNSVHLTSAENSGNHVIELHTTNSIFKIRSNSTSFPDLLQF
jgi:hypothetical protein